MSEHEGEQGILPQASGWLLEVSDEPETNEYMPELSWCPECQSPPCSDFAHVQYCDLHREYSAGTADHMMTNEYIVQGDAGGPANQAFCDMLHRKETT